MCFLSFFLFLCVGPKSVYPVHAFLKTKLKIKGFRFPTKGFV